MDLKSACWKLMKALVVAFYWITVVIGGIFYTIGSLIVGGKDYVKEVKKANGDLKQMLNE